VKNSVVAGPKEADEGMKNAAKHVISVKQFFDEQGNNNIAVF